MFQLFQHLMFYYGISTDLHVSPGNTTATWLNDLDAMAGYHCIHLIVDDVDVQCASEKIEQPHSLGPPEGT